MHLQLREAIVIDVCGLEMEELKVSVGDGYLSSDDGEDQAAQVAFVLVACKDGLRPPW